jgi:superoxide dismutase, Fe-Mn family
MGNRREFLKKTSLLGLTGLAGSLLGKEKIENIETLTSIIGGEENRFTLPALPYAYGALEPFIDKQTMEIHHTKHHQAYIDKLNTAPPTEIDFKKDDVGKCQDVNQATSAVVRNNLGGYYNHSLFWTLLKPNPEGKENIPKGKLAEAITNTFKSFDDFKKEFSDKSLKVFGSGWCWLIIDEKNNLKITSSPNQDNPLMQVASERGKPILGLDVWEHAYYLKYQNKRADYISGWWNVVNWEKAEELFNAR